MAAFVDAEYEAGVYRDYVNARELKLATMRRRMPVIVRLRPRTHGCSTSVARRASSSRRRSRRVSIRGASSYRPWRSSSHNPASGHASRCGDVNTLLAADARQFDVVTAFDIIEHTLDPASVSRRRRSRLLPGGLLVLSTPDTGHWLRPLMRSRWPMLQPDQHTFLFSRSAMRSLLVDRGYEPLVIVTARKVLTADYLFGQLRQTNPLGPPILDRAKRLLPRAMRHREVAVNIGEMLACARTRPASLD